MSENAEKKMGLQEAIDKIKAYKQNIDTALEIGHGTAASAEFSEALDIVLDRFDKLYAYMLANSRFDNPIPTPTPIEENDVDYEDDSDRSCKDCPDDECTGHCMSCYYRPV